MGSLSLLMLQYVDLAKQHPLRAKNTFSISEK